MMTENENWGGDRKGSGRPKGRKITKSLSLMGREDEIDLIKLKAENSPYSISRFCIDIILRSFDKD